MLMEHDVLFMKQFIEAVMYYFSQVMLFTEIYQGTYIQNNPKQNQKHHMGK